MDIKTLSKDIRDKILKDKYIFVGKEKAVQDIYIKKLQEIANINIYIVDKDELLEKINKRNLLKNEKTIFLCREAIEDFKNLKTNGNILIIQLEKLDKKTKFYKENKNDIIEIEQQSLLQLIIRITDVLEITEKQAEELALYSNSDFSTILNDIDKITNYSELYKVSHQKAYKVLKNDKTIYDKRETTETEFINMFFKKEKTVIDKIPTKNEFRLLYMIYNQARNLLTLQTKNNNLTSWEQIKAKEFIVFWSNKELIKLLKLIPKCLEKIKQGKIPQNYVLKYLIINMKF